MYAPVLNAYDAVRKHSRRIKFQSFGTPEPVAELALDNFQVLHSTSACGFPANSFDAPVICSQQTKNTKGEGL